MVYRDSAAGKAGSARMKELAIQDRAETDAVVAHLLKGLGRPATAAEEIDAELVGAAFVRSKRLRSQGRCDVVERQMLAQLMRGSVFGSIAAPPPVPTLINPATDGMTYRAVDRASEPEQAPVGDGVTT